MFELAEYPPLFVPFVTREFKSVQEKEEAVERVLFTEKPRSPLRRYVDPGFQRIKRVEQEVQVARSQEEPRITEGPELEDGSSTSSSSDSLDVDWEEGG